MEDTWATRERRMLFWDERMGYVWEGRDVYSQKGKQKKRWHAEGVATDNRSLIW